MIHVYSISDWVAEFKRGAKKAEKGKEKRRWGDKETRMVALWIRRRSGEFEGQSREADGEVVGVGGDLSAELFGGLGSAMYSRSAPITSQVVSEP